MTTKTNINPNILFKKIRNQFLAATIGICVTIAVLISVIVSYKLETIQLVVIVSAFLIIVIIAVFLIINLNKYSPEIANIRKIDVENMIVAQKISQIIVSFGENCLQVEVTDNHRAFAANALATYLESYIENITLDEKQLVILLSEIKNVSMNEKQSKDSWTEVLNKKL